MQQNASNFGGLLTVPKPNRATVLDFLSSPRNDFDDDLTHFSPYPQHELSGSADIRSPFSNFGGKGLGISESTTPEVVDEVQGRINNALGISKSQTWVGLDRLSTKPNDSQQVIGMGSNVGWKSTSDLQSFEDGFSVIFGVKAPSRLPSAMPEQHSMLPRALSTSSLSAAPGLNGLLQQQQIQQEDSAWPKPMRYNHFNQNHHQASTPSNHNHREVNNNSTGPCIRPPSSSNNSNNDRAYNFNLQQSHSQNSLLLLPQQLQQQNNVSEENLMIQKTFTPPPQTSPRTSTLTNNNHAQPPPPPPIANKSGIGALDERAIENVIANNCQQILMDAAEHMLKAVELANTLRARVGIEVLALVRERWGGLLSLLERHPDRFVVERIAKNDRVLLVDPTDTSRVSSSSNNSSSGGSDRNPVIISSVTNDNNNSDSSSSDYHRISSVTTNNNNNSKISDNNNSHSHHQHIHDQNNSALPTDGCPLGASRCLHVGNVPATFTEIQLLREFEKFGQLDGLKLINQKNGQRRFAFITFRTVEQAITARYCLSKVHPWKSAISFAHKELALSSPAVAPAPPPVEKQHVNTVKQAQQGKPLGAEPQVQQQLSQASTTARRLDPNARTFVSEQEMMRSHHHFLHQPLHAPPFLEPHDPRRAIPQRGIQLTAATPSFLGGIEATGSGLAGREKAILLRLCDDTYVPTQPWPVDLEADLTVCRSIAEQITHFGGSVAISKLRGFLKHRIGTTDNIKSVPLKALLLAYSSVFRVEGSFVSLVSAATSEASFTSA